MKLIPLVPQQSVLPANESLACSHVHDQSGTLFMYYTTLWLSSRFACCKITPISSANIKRRDRNWESCNLSKCWTRLRCIERKTEGGHHRICVWEGCTIYLGHSLLGMEKLMVWLPTLVYDDLPTAQLCCFFSLISTNERSGRVLLRFCI